MGKVKKSSSENTEKMPSYRIYFSFILICSMFILPFICHIYVEELYGKSLELFSSDNGTIVDLFLKCKETVLFAIALTACAFFVGEKIFPDKPFRNNPLSERKSKIPLICISIYLVFSVLSGIFSENKDVIIWGLHTEYEGIIAVFSYCAVFLAGYNYCSTEKIRSFYKKAFFILITVTSFLALFEYIYSPIIELPFMKYIISPKKYYDIAENIHISNGFRESVLMFYNSNYMGGFCTIIFPVSVYYAVSAETKVKQILFSLVSFLSFASVIMSNSTASFYVAVAEILILAVIFSVKKVLSLKSVLSGSAVIVVTALIINFGSGNEFGKNFIKSLTNAGTYQSTESVFNLNEIGISGNSVIIKSNESKYIIRLPVNENEVMTISGADGTTFEKKKSDGEIISIKDIASGADINACLSQGILYLDLGYKNTVDFAVTTSGVKAIVQNAELIDEIPKSVFNKTNLSSVYSVATGRGYIWLNTLPILKNCFLLGKGAGNFPFYFVQNDIAGLLKAQGTSHLVIDKPHNWYLQIAVTSGIPALLAILILFVLFVKYGIKFIFSKNPKRKNNDSIFIICLFTGLCGFMVTGLVNDSIVSVSPFFWFNFGIAFYWLSSIREKSKK